MQFALYSESSNQDEKGSQRDPLPKNSVANAGDLSCNHPHCFLMSLNSANWHWVGNNNSQLLAYCSLKNTISITDSERKQEYTFEGVQLKHIDGNLEYYTWTHVREIPSTNLLVSLSHSSNKSANMKIFDISRKGQKKDVYSFEEILGSNY
mgnify:CR=1 FL=1